MNNQYQTKIIDFGIAKVHGNNITLSCQTLGTMNYIPPEQIDNAKSVDYRVDIYGLGATLYYLLLGKPPYFDTKGIHALTLKITSTPVTPLKELMNIPVSISNLVENAMKYDKKERYQTAQEMFMAIKKELEKFDK